MLKRTLYSGIGLLLIALAFLVFNLLSGLLFSQARLDLTQQKLYTLSEGTIRILNNLQRPIELQFFFSDELARDLPALRNYARRVEEMLKTYVDRSAGKITLKRIDPKPFSEEEDRAAELGLQGVPMQQMGDNLYFGLVGGHPSEGDTTEAIPFFQQDREAFLEYEISRLIQSLAQTERPLVGILSGLPMEGGFDFRTQQPTGPWVVLEEVRQMFRLQALPPATNQIPDEVSVLMLVHPKDLSESTRYAIDQFVLRGGKLLVFVDPYSEVDSSMDLAALQEDSPPIHHSNLETLFQAWGLRLIPDRVVADPAYAISVNLDGQKRPVRHPVLLSLPARALDKQDIVSSELDMLNVATIGALEPLPDAATRFTPLVRSSEEALLVDTQRLFNLNNPRDLLRGLKASGTAYTLAARVQGPAKSAFPEGVEGRVEGLKSADSINVIVVADTDLLADRLWVQVQEFFGQPIPTPWADNASLVINALDNLAGSDALISVRSRGRYSRPFTRVEAIQRDAEEQFREKEERLQQRLMATEQRLVELQGANAQALEMSPEQQHTLQQFLQEKLAIRKELREVRYDLNADIEALGRSLKFINIALMPLLLTLGALFWLWRHRRVRPTFLD